VLLKSLFHVIKTTFRTVRFDRAPDLLRLTFESRLEATVEGVIAIKLPDEPMDNESIFTTLDTKESIVISSLK